MPPRVYVIAIFVAIFAFLFSVLFYETDLFDHYFKSFLDNTSFFFGWIGLLYYVLPVMAFRTASKEDWDLIRIDCFTPFALWMDVVTIVLNLLFFLFFLGDIQDNFDAVLVEFTGVCLTLMAIHTFLTNEKKETDQSRKQSVYLLQVFMICGFVTLFQIQFQWTIPPNLWATCIALFCATNSMGVQAFQCIAPIISRIKSGNFNEDTHPIYKVKMYATLISFITSAYDLWSYHEKQYWFSPRSSSQFLMIMTACTFCFSAVTSILGSIGPHKLGQVYFSGHEWCGKTTNGVASFAPSMIARWKLWMGKEAAATNVNVGSSSKAPSGGSTV